MGEGGICAGMDGVDIFPTRRQVGRYLYKVGFSACSLPRQNRQIIERIDFDPEAVIEIIGRGSAASECRQ